MQKNEPLTPIFVVMVSRIQHFLLACLCCSLSTITYGQWDNSFFDVDRSDTQVGLVQLNVENLGYFRNTEYKSRIDQGRTLFGYQMWPELTLQSSEKLQVSLGLFVQQDFGADEAITNQPTFSFQYKHKGHFLRFGTLIGAMQHQLVEPLFDPERIIENRLENGFQYKRFGKTLDAELWVDWRKMIYQNSPFREEFTSGVRVEPKKSFGNHVISLPITALSFHKGGEIDTSHMPTISNFNFDYGFRYRQVKKGGFLDSIDLQLHALYYEDISTEQVNYIDGLGQYASLAFYAKGFGLMLNYYDAHQFHNPMGDVAYRSVSARNSTYIFDYRKLAMVRAQWQTQIASDFNFMIRANLMRNLKSDVTDVVAEFYFRWTPRFDLFKIN